MEPEAGSSTIRKESGKKLKQNNIETSHKQIPKVKKLDKQSESPSIIQSIKRSKIKSTNSSPLRTPIQMMPLTPSNSLPQKIQQFCYRKHSENYSENEKKRRLKKKLEYANQVGWQQRQGRHRHPHQARREKALINYQNGLPQDYDSDSE